MANGNNDQCPICSGRVDVLTTPFTRYNYERVSRFTCPRCGVFDIFEQDVSRLSGQIGRISQDKPWVRALLSYWTRKAQSAGEPPLFQRNLIDQIVSEQRLPTAHEQADNLIRYLGEQLQSHQDPGGEARFVLDELISIVGCLDRAGIWYLADQLDRNGLLAFPLRRAPNEPLGPPARVPPSERFATIGTAHLTFEGWKRFCELQRAYSEGPIAFMAMPFGNPLLDRVFLECFKPAVARTGFDLPRVIDSPPARLIDDRWRVEMRRSRFVVCELTNRNPGAYWEAGFAEGLGRPVIYTCEKAYFQTKGTHFDTKHCHTVLWTEINLPEASEGLKATIRATLPGEAKLMD